jgi:hypothetical protein
MAIGLIQENSTYGFFQAKAFGLCQKHIDKTFGQAEKEVVNENYT